MSAEIPNGAEAQTNAGSPAPGEPAFLVVGRLRRAHGIHGEIIMDVLTDFPERLRSGTTVYVGDSHQPQRIRKQRVYENDLLISFYEIDDRETVGELRNSLVYVRTDEIPALPEGEYYYHQLFGLKVISEDGALLGQVVDILETGANDVLVVRGEKGPEILLPYIHDVILNLNLELGEISVRLIPGILPDK